MAKNRKEALERLARLEAQLRYKARAGGLVYGVYRPEGMLAEHCYNMRKVNGVWEYTSEPHDITIAECLTPILLRPKRFVILVGGRGSGKSLTVGGLIGADAHDEAASAMCLREFQASIKDSVHPLLANRIEEYGLDGFDILEKEIRHENGANIRFKGMARDPDGVKSAFGFKRFWGEEAQTFSEESIRKLTPTMREEGGIMLFTANPGSSEDPFSKRFINPFWEDLLRDGIYEDDLHLVIRVNWSDNPWFPPELRAEMEFDRKTLSRALFDHVWEGHFNDSVPDAIIPAEWFDAAIDAHKVLGFSPSGMRIGALDPADVGTDNKAYGERQGSVVTLMSEWYEGDANDAVDRAISEAKSHGVEAFVWDRAGLGAGLRRQVTEAYAGTNVIVDGYNAGEGVKGPDELVELDHWLNNKTEGDNLQKNIDAFANRGSQDMYLLRRRFEKTYEAVVKKIYHNPDELISLDREGIGEHMQKLRAEVCRIPRVYNTNGKFARMPKPQMRTKLKMKSPGMADVLCMMMQPPERVKNDDYHGYNVPSNY